MLFTFTIEGNIASTPRLTVTKNGHQVCTVRVLHNTRYRNQAGQWVDGRTISIDLSCWRDLAERVASLNKGDAIIAEVADDLYIDTSGRFPVLQATARTVAVSMRFHGATSKRTAPADPDHREVPSDAAYDTGATRNPEEPVDQHPQYAA